MATHPHITQNNKFAISLQNVKKVVNDAVDFLHAYKHESLLQIDIDFDGGVQVFPKLQK